MLRLLSVILMAVLVASCATGFDSTVQRIDFDLVNMQKARCDVYNTNGIVKTRAYIFHLPGTYNVERSLEDLHLDCQGLRGVQTKLVVSSVLNETSNKNVVNLGLGVAVDAASQALFKYPERIVVDFTQAVYAANKGGESSATTTNVTPYMVSPSSSEVEHSHSASHDMLDRPLCDGNDSQMKCAHKVYNPDVAID